MGRIEFRKYRKYLYENNVFNKIELIYGGHNNEGKN